MMRVRKNPISFCLSLLSTADLSQACASRIRFHSGIVACLLRSAAGDQSLGSTRSLHNAGANQLHASHIMDDDVVDDKTSLLEPAVCSDYGQDQRIWSSYENCKIDVGKQIFCNTSLNMKNIVAVGFDMDYTLAQYKSDTFETLAYYGTIRKLVDDLGYPPELLDWSFDWKYMVKGLVLDKKRGNILKMDRHKYIKIAHHGFREMSKSDKIATYGNTLIRNPFDEPDYALIDTLFSLAQAYLFAQLVDFKDLNPKKVPLRNYDYSQIYEDVRAAVSLCHRDGTLKQVVAKDPGKYINEDPSILTTLKIIRDSGRATFLVTNSLWDYTNVVMNFLCGCQASNGNSPCYNDWLENFDIVITGSSKPSFFYEDNRANLFEVEPETGMLVNTDNGIPNPQIGNISPKLPPKRRKKGCRIFQGGSVGHLHKLLSIESSSQVLYVGDHIYGDILQSKKVLGWRTMLVVPELEREVKLLWESRDTCCKELRLLRRKRDFIEDKIHHVQWSLNYTSNREGGPTVQNYKSISPLLEWFEDVNAEEKLKFSSELKKLESQLVQVCLSHQQTQQKYHQKFHIVWGQLMKTGYQNSRFAHQVERFACLYTSHVSNLSLYSPDKYYRPNEDFLPHEFDNNVLWNIEPESVQPSLRLERELSTMGNMHI